MIWYQLLLGDFSRAVPTGRGWMRTLEKKGVPAGQIELIAACFDSEAEERPGDAGAVGEAIERTRTAPEGIPAESGTRPDSRSSGAPKLEPESVPVPRPAGIPSGSGGVSGSSAPERIPAGLGTGRDSGSSGMDSGLSLEEHETTSTVISVVVRALTVSICVALGLSLGLLWNPREMLQLVVCNIFLMASGGVVADAVARLRYGDKLGGWLVGAIVGVIFAVVGVVSVFLVCRLVGISSETRGVAVSVTLLPWLLFGIGVGNTFSEGILAKRGREWLDRRMKSGGA